MLCETGGLFRFDFKKRNFFFLSNVVLQIVLIMPFFFYSGPDEWHGHLSGFISTTKWKSAQFRADGNLDGGLQNEPHRELLAPDNDSGGDPVSLFLHRGGRILQTHQGQSYRSVRHFCCLNNFD